MKGEMFRPTIRAIGVCVALATHPPAFADATKSAEFPPVENASFHQPVFADEDFSVLNNLYPPGGDSGFHTHYLDMFYVVIQAGQASVQNLGKPATAGPRFAAGTAAFGSLGGEPRVHRVVNGNESTYQIIVVQLRRTEPRGNAVSSRETAKGYTQITDNSRLRAWRLILEPGQSAASISQLGKGFRVVVRGGLLTTISPGLPNQILALKPGDHAVQSAGTSRALTNSGTETIELVEIELK